MPWKLTVTTGEPANPGADEPSMVTVLVIAGSDVRPTRIVPATAKSIVSGPGWSLDAMIACRSEPAPEAWRFVTVNVVRSSRLSRISRSHSRGVLDRKRSLRASIIGGVLSREVGCFRGGSDGPCDRRRRPIGIAGATPLGEGLVRERRWVKEDRQVFKGVESRRMDETHRRSASTGGFTRPSSPRGEHPGATFPAHRTRP